MKRRRQRGSTLVESAVIMLTFMVVITAIFDLAHAVFFHHVLNARVRDGVRYASVHAYDPDAIKRFVAYNSTSPSNTGPGILGLTPEQVTVTRLGVGTANERIEVKVESFSMSFVSPWLPRTLAPGPFRAILPVETLGSAS